MLAGWFRLKYPNIVAGAIAASAPIICGNDTVQYAFNEIVTDDYAAAGCSQGMQKAFTQISSLLTVRLRLCCFGLGSCLIWFGLVWFD